MANVTDFAFWLDGAPSVVTGSSGFEVWLDGVPLLNADTTSYANVSLVVVGETIPSLVLNYNAAIPAPFSGEAVGFSDMTVLRGDSATGTGETVALSTLNVNWSLQVTATGEMILVPGMVGDQIVTDAFNVWLEGLPVLEEDPDDFSMWLDGLPVGRLATLPPVVRRIRRQVGSF